EEELDLFYDKLFEKAEAAAHRVRDHVLKPLAAEFGLDSIQPWDMPYLLRYATERRAQFSQEELREYFPLEACLQRLFDQYAALYGISFAVINNPTVWHESVKGFIVYDRHSNILGEIYCDFFARPFKAEGAWMQYVCNKSDLKSHKQHSVVILVMNFSQDLLLIDEVCTLYHEFGHGFHQLFSTKKYPLISGIENVPWDIVELPSQLSEQWFLMKESLEKFLHPTKQTPLSPNIIEAILTNEQAFGPIFILRQLMLGFFDWKIHGLSGGDCDPHEEWLNIQKRWSITPVVDRDYRWADFGHLFAGGYAAGYYGYLYSEVFVHDVFQRMRKIQGERSIAEAGADFYDAFLCQAADRTLRDKLDNFLGGAVKLDPFLKHYGLIDYV
ncbi:MAG: M3 family metallopeptidase, partial [Gammaproteobacteria bacterium]|nr:M3 family metallopeptidase [Gammaproteobacteria bacterium]